MASERSVGRLAITRRQGESVKIGDALVTVVNLSASKVESTIEAPRDVKIVRTELDGRAG